jgi:hypothetical protein
MINGAHVILYSANADADRGFLRDVIGLGHVDVGDGWLIFGLPPAEVAIHPGEDGGAQEVYLMCDDIGAFVAAMEARAIACTPPVDRGWGILTEVTLPGGGKLGVYQPRHARPAVPPAPAGSPARRAPSRKAAGKGNAGNKARQRAAAAKKTPSKRRKAAPAAKTRKSKRR